MSPGSEFTEDRGSSEGVSSERAWTGDGEQDRPYGSPRDVKMAGWVSITEGMKRKGGQREI